jgi:hypothetical protein
MMRAGDVRGTLIKSDLPVAGFRQLKPSGASALDRPGLCAMIRGAIGERVSWNWV